MKQYHYKTGDVVKCIIPASDFGLIENKIYVVSEVTEKNNVLLKEVKLPKPFTSFCGSRFEFVSENILDEYEDQFLEMYEDEDGYTPNEGEDKWEYLKHQDIDNFIM